MSAANGAPATIGDYAVLGDTRTAALVSPAGSIDWLCLPRFDSEPVFGSLIDQDNGGRFSIEIVGGTVASRAYRHRSATLETTFRTRRGDALLVDGFVLDVSSDFRPQTLLVRSATCTRGEVTIKLLFDPRGGFGGRPPTGSRHGGVLVASAGARAFALRTAPDLAVEPGRPLSVTLRAGETLTAVLSAADRQPLIFMSPIEGLRLLDETDRWWRTWCEDIHYEGPHRGAVERSLITLRLLTYAPSGAPVAAPTTSIPAPPGSRRAWDYRYSWPRDASLGVQAFLAHRGVEEPDSFLRWLCNATKNTRPCVEALYTLDGRRPPQERTLSGLRGYAGEDSVRVGNGAAGQHQLDVYGWVVEAAWLMVDSGEQLERETWSAVSAFADFVAKHWREPDNGIWEIRAGPAHYVHSKLMGWTALDRSLRIARSHQTKPARKQAWRTQRDALAEQVRAQGFDERRGAYVRAYGQRELDASTLLLPILDFDEADSPRIGGTIDAVRDELDAGGSLLFRYPPGSDGLEGEESAFVACSFWLAQALARTGRLEQAEAVFDEMCGRSTPLGLYAEQINPTTGIHEGNFPQALSHAALLQAAAALNEASGSRPRSRRRPRDQ